MRLALLGIQGSGKSTQARLIAKVLKLPHISVGQLLRALSHEHTKEGEMVKSVITAGELLPDDFTISFVKKHLMHQDYSSGYVIDGFPRTVGQAHEFIAMIDNLIYLDLDEKEALWRLAGRVEDRDDTTLSAVYERIKLYKEVTTPVIEVFKKAGKLISVDATPSIETIHNTIMKALKVTH